MQKKKIELVLYEKIPNFRRFQDIFPLRGPKPGNVMGQSLITYLHNREKYFKNVKG